MVVNQLMIIKYAIPQLCLANQYEQQIDLKVEMYVDARPECSQNSNE